MSYSTLPTILTMSYNSSTVAASTTNYFSLGGGTAAGNTTEANRQTSIPTSGIVKGFYVTTATSQSASGTLVFTVRKNGSDTAITLTLSASAAAGTYSNTSNSFTVAAGDLLSLKAVNGAGTSATIVSASVGIY